MKIDYEPKLDFDDVLIVPKRTTLQSRKQVDINRIFKFYHSPKIWSGTPIMCANMSFATLKMANALRKHNIITCLHKYHTIEKLHETFNSITSPHDHENKLNYIWLSIGYSEDELKKVKKLKNYALNICVDVPNGQMDVFANYCAKVRNISPDSIIMAGNVVDPASTQELIIHGGVDIVKVGIGPGSACTTRYITGCGYPQLSACIDNSYVAHGLKYEDRRLGLICSDGGCRYPGDVVKAFCAGADFVMLGGMFAGTSESFNNEENNDFSYYGMSTHKSQEDNAEGKKNYRASEGTKITVKNKGPVSNVVQEILGGIRSAATYIGATSIKDLNKCANFCKVNKIHSNNNPQIGI